jgi:hypothetical protein
MMADDQVPATEYRVGGGTTGMRETARPESGERPLVGVLDGWALHSPDTDAPVVETYRLAGRS